MKRTNTKHFTKLTIAIIALTILLICSNNMYSQVAILNNSVLHNYDVKTTIVKEFSSKQYNNTVYMKWVAKSTEEDFLFLVQRSYDNKDFHTIGVKKQYGADINIDLMYCFTDDKMDAEMTNIYYRIVSTSENSEETFNSDVAVIKQEKSEIETQHITSIE